MSRAVNQLPSENPGERPLPRARARRLARRLLDWFEVNQRDLPWRRDRDPYSIWVSEVMLQQTRVEAVVGPYARFLSRFPDITTLAAASEAEVLAQWAGLGYYRRARQLHAAAQRIVEQSGGRFPRTAAALRLLPGFGPYTAGAVASIAFGEEIPAIDGNVQRVIARLLALEDDPSRGPGARRVEARVRQLLAEQAPDRFNQALMELGALVCTPRAPQCGACPWESGCEARRAGVAELLPRRAPRTPTSVVTTYSAVCARGDQYLWRRRGAGEHNEGLWELPSTPWHGGEPDVDRAVGDLAALGQRLGRHWVIGEPLATIRHSITRYRVRCMGYSVVDDGAEAAGDSRWADRERATRWGITAASRKLLERVPPLL